MAIDADLARAKALARKGAVSEARGILEAVLARYPENIRAQQGLRELHDGRRRPPVQPGGAGQREQLLRELAGLYAEGRYAEVAERGRSELAGVHSRSAPLANLTGAALAVQGAVPEAMAYYARAIALDPHYAEAHHNLANALKALGRKEEALASYARALEARPGYAEAHRNLSALTTYFPGDPRIGAMEQLARAPGHSGRDRMHLGFALAKAYEDIGDTAKAFAELGAAGRLRKRELGYDIAKDRALFATIRAAFADTRTLIQDAAQVPSPLSKRPVFILGMPRSGTTLVEQILASHSLVHGAGELGALNKLAGQALTAAGRTPIPADALRVAAGALRSGYDSALAALGTSRPVVTDKMPSNFRWIGYICLALPEARIVHVRRDPMATCWSVFKTYFATGGNGFSYDIADVAEYYRLYLDLMEFWHERSPGAIYDLDYEKLTESQESETHKLLAYCGLDWEDACLTFHETKRAVETASAAQVRRAMYKGSSGEWRKFERELAPLAAALRQN